MDASATLIAFRTLQAVKKDLYTLDSMTVGSEEFDKLLSKVMDNLKVRRALASRHTPVH